MPTEVDKTLLEDYRLYMLRDLGNKESCVGNRLRHLHQVIRKALQERYVREDPFELIDIETPTYERNALTTLGLPSAPLDRQPLQTYFPLGMFYGAGIFRFEETQNG